MWGFVVLSVMLSTLWNIILSTVSCGAFMAVSKTEPVFLICLFRFYKSLALMCSLQQMASKKMALLTKDTQHVAANVEGINFQRGAKCVLFLFFFQVISVFYCHLDGNSVVAYSFCFQSSSSVFHSH